MTRCDYDGIFYRVFCVTLLAIAFTFTVILTNVFIDIDGILASKDKGKPEETTAQPQEIDSNVLVYQPEEKLEKKPEYFELKADKEEDESNYRTKRSISNKELPNYQLHLNNPKMKEILNHRLASLLEELDAEETHTTKLEKPKEEDPPKPTQDTIHKKTNVKKEDKQKAEKSEDEVMHLAMHNILLQGIIGHMDLNEVYKKVHQLLSTMEGKDARNNRHAERDKKGKHHNHKAKTQKPTEEQSQEVIEIPQNLYNIEAKFFEELVKCDQLQKQIVGAAENLGNTRRAGSSHSMEIAGKAEKRANGPKVLIKTIIDIKTLKNQSDSKTLFNSNNIKGLIKLIYNGQPIKFTRLDDDEDKKNNYELTEAISETRDNLKQDVDNILQDDNGNIVDSFLDKALAQYLKKYPTLENKFKKKRLKRNVKVRPINQNTKKAKHKKNEDEELYVEIETHFDSKGIKGEKKKKMIKNLVEKIQKAIHTNIDTLQEVGKKDKKLNTTLIKKRLQNPLETKEKGLLMNKIIIPINNILHRESHPISKVVKISESVPKVYDQSGENWKQAYHASNFLSSAKSINSGEMGRVDLDYSNVLKNTGIPQRLQQPLNTDNMKEVVDSSNYFNLGDLQFFVKEIDGTGFSIGFNQYVGEAPDPDSIKLFTGLQQLVQTYNQNNNDMDNKNEVENRYDSGNIERNVSGEVNHEMKKREVNRMKSPATILFDDDNSNADYHSNEYQLVFDENVLPYDSYSQIFEDPNKKISLSIEKDKQSTLIGKDDSNLQTESLPLMLDENLFKKQLKPSEIFGLASLLERKKRSPIVVKKYSNLNTRTKSRINRFINTNRMTQGIDKNIRSKRQIDKIRIIATDSLPRVSRHSDENVFVVSDENMFADRAVVRDPDVPEQEVDQQEEGSEFVIPHHLYDHAPTPYNQLNSHFNPYNIFSSRSRHNSLMSKYPHLFLEEMSHSKEEDSPVFYNKLMKSYTDSRKNLQPTSPPFLVTPVQIPTPMKGNLVSDLSDINLPKTNYKLTVKIMPKNNTDIHSGFKEVHTSINKSVNRNGLVYSSLVNMTEFSKVENLNKPNQGEENHVVNRHIIIHKPINQGPLNHQVVNDTLVVTERPEQATVTSYMPLVKHIREQQEKMKVLLRQHKKRIDEQLDTLKLEKQNIESIIPNDKKADIDVMLPLNPPQMLHLNKAEAEQLISNALMKLHDAPHLNDVSLPNGPLNVTPEVMPSTTPVTPLPQSTIEPDKLRILRTIQRNENLTNAILYKIDRNTNILQTFLQKLADRFEPVTPKQEYLQQEPKLGYENEWKAPIHAPFFTQTMPNLEVQRNATHVSIPFVYAYQQPYPLPSKSNSPVASVVYQGHIHTNAYNTNLKLKEKTKKLTDKREANHTRFFLDDLDEFKAVPVKPSARKGYEIPRIKTNFNITSDIKNS